MKRAFLIILSLLILSPLFSSQIDYVYKNSISSVSFENAPQKGQLFNDSNGNLYVVKQSNEEVTVLDLIYAKTGVKEGALLSEKNSLYKICAYVSTKSAGVDFSFNVKAIYPLEPYVCAGIGYNGKVTALGGIKLSCQLSSIFRTEIKLLQNGLISSYACLGIGTDNKTAVACGIEYGNIVGRFFWKAGLQWLVTPATRSTLIIPVVSLGACL